MPPGPSGPGTSMKDLSPTYSSILYSETSVSNKDVNTSATYIRALNGDLDRDGFLFRVEGAADFYRYDTILNNAAAHIDAKEAQGGAYAGYQIVRGGMTYGAYAGVDVKSIRLSPEDSDNPVKGRKIGFKTILDAESENDRPYYANVAGEYSTAFNTYWVRMRAGLKSGRGAPKTSTAFGPEASFAGDTEFDARRAGAFVLVPLNLKSLGRMEVIAAGGYQWVTNNDNFTASTAGGKGGYATLSFSIPF
jgi:hypothetical protein